MPTRPSVQEQIRYDHLTWSEVNEAAALKKMIVLPIGSTQQHGPHLPVDADCLIVESLALAAAEQRKARVLVAPTLPYSYNVEAMDFPGTVSVAAQTFMDFCISVVKGFAYHGFDHILIVNGFAANDNLIELIARQINMETGALCGSINWTRLLVVDEAFNDTWRESAYPGNSHADELETSLYLALDEESVALDRAVDYLEPPRGEGLEANFVFEDHFGGGAIYVPGWTSDRSPNGVLGEPSKASVEKGRRIRAEAVTNLVAVVDDFYARAKRAPVDHHTGPKYGPLPLGIS
ncbi:MAG: creatininase family protein [Litorilinea sp.]